MAALINVLLKFMLVMATGYALNRVGILVESTQKKLSEIIVKVALPAMTIAAAFGYSDSKGDVFVAMGMGVALYAVLPFIAILLVKLIRPKKEERNLYIFMLVFGNTGFIGFPIIEAIYGSNAVMLAATLHQMPFNLLIFTYGVFLFNSEDGKIKFSKKILLHPGILSIPVALLIFVSGVKVPEFIQETFSMIGGLTTPLSMLVIGASLSAAPFRKIIGQGRLYILAFLRLLLVPVTLYFLLSFLPISEMLRNIFTITAALPAGANTVIFSHEYKKDVRLATSGVFITTVLSGITIPLMVLFIEWAGKII